MQFQRKLIKHSWENDKKLILELILTCLPQLLTSNRFFVGFTSTRCYMLLQAIILCNFKENTWTKLEEMTKKSSFRPNFGPFWPKFGPPKFFRWVLPPVDLIHCCKLPLYAIARKTTQPNLKNGKKPSFGSNFGPFGPSLCPKYFVLELYLH